MEKVIGGCWSEDLPAGLSEQRSLSWPRVLWLPGLCQLWPGQGQRQDRLWEEATPDPRASSRLQCPNPLFHVAQAPCPEMLSAVPEH